jgi:hypothetical protein
MLGLAALVVLVAAVATLAFVARPHRRDDFGPSVRDYAAFRAALAATGQTRDHVRV